MSKRGILALITVHCHIQPKRKIGCGRCEHRSIAAADGSRSVNQTMRDGPTPSVEAEILMWWRECDGMPTDQRVMPLCRCDMVVVSPDLGNI